MVAYSPHPETLRRLDRVLQEKEGRSKPLDAAELAVRAALPVSTVRALLQGGVPPDGSVNDRVRMRIAALAEAEMAATGTRMSDLASDISERLGVSGYWARQACDGRKVPSVELLHGLVEYFGVEEGETFFTASAADALNRARLRPRSDRRRPVRPRRPRHPRRDGAGTTGPCTASSARRRTTGGRRLGLGRRPGRRVSGSHRHPAQRRRTSPRALRRQGRGGRRTQSARHGCPAGCHEPGATRDPAVPARHAHRPRRPHLQGPPFADAERKTDVP